MAKDFTKTIVQFAQIANARLTVIVKKIGFDALNQVMARSPVDTGRFRAAWRLNVDSADLDVPGEDQVVASVDTQLAKLAGFQIGQSIHISNNLPYAQALEDGSSDQAPTGVLKNTFDVIVSSINSQVQNAKREIPDV